MVWQIEGGKVLAYLVAEGVFVGSHQIEIV